MNGGKAARRSFQRFTRNHDLRRVWRGWNEQVGGVKLYSLGFKSGVLAIVNVQATFALLNPGKTDAAVTVTSYMPDGTVAAENSISIGAGMNMTGMVTDLTGDAVTNPSHIMIVCNFSISSGNDTMPRTYVFPLSPACCRQVGMTHSYTTLTFPPACSRQAKAGNQ